MGLPEDRARGAERVGWDGPAPRFGGAEPFGADRPPDAAPPAGAAPPVGAVSPIVRAILPSGGRAPPAPDSRCSPSSRVGCLLEAHLEAGPCRAAPSLAGTAASASNLSSSRMTISPCCPGAELHAPTCPPRRPALGRRRGGARSPGEGIVGPAMEGRGAGAGVRDRSALAVAHPHLRGGASVLSWSPAIRAPPIVSALSPDGAASPAGSLTSSAGVDNRRPPRG